MTRPTRRARNARIQAYRRRRTIVLAVLTLITGALWLKNILFESPTSALARPSGASETAAPDEDPRSPGGTVHIGWPAMRDRNPFTFDRTVYVPIAEPEPLPPAAPEAPAGPSDEEIALRELEKLVLQATVEGDLPRAVVNGLSLRPGDAIGGFTVVEIGTRSVTLRFRSVEVTLEM